MPSRTLSDKVDEPGRLLTAVSTKRKSLEADVASLDSEHGGTASGLAEIKTVFARIENQIAELHRFRDELSGLKAEVSVQRRDLDELRKTREEWSRRLWALAGPVIGALVGVVVG